MFLSFVLSVFPLSRMDIMMSMRVSFVVSDPAADQPSFLRSPGSRRGRGVCGLWSVVCVSVSLCPVCGLWMGEEEEQQQQQEEEEQQVEEEQEEQQEQQQEEQELSLIHI